MSKSTLQSYSHVPEYIVVYVFIMLHNMVLLYFEFIVFECNGFVSVMHSVLYSKASITKLLLK